MTSQETLNIVTISLSTILSVGAIILSFWFYRESNKQNKETVLMQNNIKNAVEKLEKLYEKIYTDTFSALKNQMNAMQKHIFKSSVGNINTSEPDQLRFSVLGCITERNQLTINELCKRVTVFQTSEITETVYSFHREGIVSFDGENIQYIVKTTNNNNTDGQEG